MKRPKPAETTSINVDRPARNCVDRVAGRAMSSPTIEYRYYRKTMGRYSMGVKLSSAAAMSIRGKCGFAKTAMHNGTEYATGCRGTTEIEAESVAHIICHTAGLVSGPSSFGYD